MTPDIAAPGVLAALDATASSLPFSLRGNARLSSWLRIRRDGHAEAYSGKVEIGQGILTALAQIVADELDLELDQVRMIAASTACSPDEAVTSGSLSITHSGTALRHVCADVRAIYLDRCAALHEVPRDAIEIRGGEFLAQGRRLASYWELADDALLDRDADPHARPRAATGYRHVGRALPRDDLAEKVYGRFRFVHDMVLPGMLHARMVRPPSPGAELVRWDSAEVEGWEGVVAVVRDGSQAGVIAQTEFLAERAAAHLARRAAWRHPTPLPAAEDVAAWLKTRPTVELQWDRVRPTATSRAASESPSESSPTRTLRAAYSKPYLKHASMGPSCAIALFEAEDASAGAALRIWTHSQGIYNLRKDLSLAFGLPEDGIVVQHVQGAGCYGHNGADDAAYDAAWLARHCRGRPLRLQWSRAEEMNWAPQSPPMAVEIEADVDAQGRVRAWRHELWSPGHGLRPGRAATPTLMGSWYLARPFPHLHAVDAPRNSGGGADRNAEPEYAFPRVDVCCHRTLDIPIRTSAMRALGAYANVFAIESFMDELAQACGQDPLEYRLSQLEDERGAAVLRAAAALAGWPRAPRDAADGAKPMEDGTEAASGMGIGYARYKGTSGYCAVVAQVSVEERVRVRRLCIAVDVGLAINPDGIRNQVEGGALQTLSWTLFEGVRFDGAQMVGDNWEHYPILRFGDVPDVEVTLIDRPDQPSLGAGEAVCGPTVAAIANAVSAALGIRVRHLPLTAEQIARAIDNEHDT
jgi:CO/xanthine dehydrogenase Mo-binding subunit